jgi:hypothetical protein
VQRCYPPIVVGTWGRLLWATNANGKSPARDFFFEELLPDEQELVMGQYFLAIAETGNRFAVAQSDKLRILGGRGGPRGRHLWEIRIVKGSAKGQGQIRFLGAFRMNDFAVAHGVRKKQNKLDPEDIEKAARILQQYFSTN